MNQAGKKRTALGQGLNALIPVEPPRGSTASDGSVRYVTMDMLTPNPLQPRRVFREEALSDLTNSIREMGVIQPLIVRPRGDGIYEIIAGERRWRAAKAAGFQTIPVVVREVSDSEALEIALIENLQREDLNPLDTAEAYDTLIKSYSYTHEALAKRIGKDRSNITNHIRLLNLPDPVKDDLRSDRLSMGHARTLLSVDDLPTLMNLRKKAVGRKLSVRELERIVKNYHDKKAGSAPKKPDKSDDLVALERELSRHMSTRVEIRQKSKTSGKLEIQFHSLEELERITEMLGYQADFA